MPSSPLVCHLRRELARRVDLLAGGLEGDTSACAADGGGTGGKKRTTRGIGKKRVAADLQCGQGGMGSPDRRSNHFKNEALDCRNKNRDGGDASSMRASMRMANREALVKGWAGGSSERRGSSIRRVARVGSVLGKNSLTRWIGGAEEGGSANFPQDDVGNRIIAGGRGNSSSNSSNSSGSGNTGSASDCKPVEEGLETMRRALTKLDERSSTREAVRTRGRAVMEMSPVTVRGDEQRGGDSDTSFRPAEGGPRARAVRFLLEDSKKEKDGHDGDNPQLVSIREAVDGGASQTTQTKQVERGRSKATARQEREAETEEDCQAAGFWTCVVCRKQNDEVGGLEGCSTCGRRRRQQQQQRQRSQDNENGERLPTVQADSRIVESTRQLKEKGGERHQNVTKTFRVCSTTSSAGSSVRTDTDARTAARETAVGSEHRGPYDVSSFAKMREATQPIVKARLGLTREIHSLLSAIRK